jgi:sugar phosphate isomerase/epimerase
VAELCFNMFNRSAWFGIDPDLVAQIDAAAAAGFPLVGPDVFSLDAWTAQGRRVEELADRMAAAGVRCWEIAGFDVGDREGTLAQAAHLADLARVLHPTWILTNVSRPVDADVATTLAMACDTFEAVGTLPAIEYLPFTPVSSIPIALDLVERVGRDRTAILLDTWHHFRGPDTFAVLDELDLEHVAYVQFDDALPAEGDDLVAETLHRRTFPGDGEFDLDHYCERMRAKGFDGVVSVEVLNAEWRGLDRLGEFAHRAHASTRRFWPLVAEA